MERLIILLYIKMRWKGGIVASVVVVSRILICVMVRSSMMSISSIRRRGKIMIMRLLPLRMLLGGRAVVR